MHNKKRIIVIVVVIIFLIFVAMGSHLLPTPGEEGSGNQQNLTAYLLQHKTDYVGDNSAVGTLVTLLIFPDDIRQQTISLQTEAEPYGITVNFSADEKALAYYSIEDHQTDFAYNAYILLALIGNLGTVDYIISDESNQVTMHYTREMANEALGEDVKNFAQSEKKLAELVYHISYTEEEVAAAKDCVQQYIKEKEPQKTINKIWFDENRCDLDRSVYMTNGRGAKNNVLEENVIVVYCTFVAADQENAASVDSVSKYILIRKGAAGEWQVDDVWK
jgi:hypothetical protein